MNPANIAMTFRYRVMDILCENCHGCSRMKAGNSDEVKIAELFRSYKEIEYLWYWTPIRMTGLPVEVLFLGKIYTHER